MKKSPLLESKIPISYEFIIILNSIITLVTKKLSFTTSKDFINFRTKILSKLFHIPFT